MSSFTEASFLQRLKQGCAGCGGKKFVIKTYVEGVFPLLDGESDGSVDWGYKGETFVDGVFEVRCAGCKSEIFADSCCPRCHAPGGLAVALGATNTHPIPRVCPTCGGDTVRYRAFVPVTVNYEGKQVGKARSGSELDEPGFHGVRADCSECGPIDTGNQGCPLCSAPGPIRAQPR